MTRSQLNLCLLRWAACLVTLPLLALRGQGETAVTDPAKPAQLTSFSDRQPASTLAMARRLADIRERANPRDMAFLNDRSIGVLREAISKATNQAQLVQLQFQLGVQLLQAGQTESSLELLAGVESAVQAVGGRLSDRGRFDLRMRRAVALLRLGEQENCLINHNGDSCLFPLQPKAFHQLPRGSRGAIGLLSEQLGEYPGDVGARWLLNLAHMTLGEYPDKVPATWLIPPKTFASEHEMPRFPEVAAALGLDVMDLAGGCILDDFDNDGFNDLVSSSWSLSGQLRMFRNDGKGRFVERTKEAGFEGLVSGLTIMQTDYNNDGWLDIWVPRGRGSARPGDFRSRCSGTTATARSPMLPRPPGC